jgi:HSP20 family protein
MQLFQETNMANLTPYGSIDDFFREVMPGFLVRPLKIDGEAELSIKLDVKENGDAYRVRADIPGVKKEDIQVTVDGSVVTLRAEVKKEKEEKKGDKVLCSERYEGMVSRSFQLPADIDMAKAVASYKDGVLELTLPKQAGTASRTLAVQ